MSLNSHPAKWSEVRINNWTELLNELHSSKLIPPADISGGHRRSPFVFRGMSSESWPLETSIERLGTSPEKIERPALRAFGKYAPRGTFERDSDWECLAVSQHNGLPTRCLDWTAAPLIVRVVPRQPAQ